ncbi:MAG TPA: fasciclin domain-containing protein [Methanocella sp.]|uniref:fasciclin domain-containing protein n=1 Tax=Methanocella sp. TaxID=2052833 RepID=UPI002BA3ED32|nr:fasciclin domain-containing protein [Methanocella sp.]HTY90598.1 fasciclin domain-containing protein [Methanocella sp.]
MSDIKKLVLVMIILATLAGMTIPMINAQSTGKTMLENMASRPEFSSVVNLAKAAGLDGVLNGAAPYTLFAPTNNAIASLPSDRVKALMDDKPLLANLVKYHVVPGKISYADLSRMTSIKTVDGRTLPVTVKNGVVSVAGAKISPGSGIDSTNGMIYPVDSVLLPPGFALPQAQVSRSSGLPGWLPWLLGAIVLGGIALYFLTRGSKPKTYEKAYEAARARPEEHLKAEETMRQVRESLASVREPNVQDIAKNVDLPLSGDALKGLNELISKGTFANKQDFLGFLGKQYIQNNIGAAMAGGSEPGISTIMDIINTTGIAKGFTEGDIKKYLVPLLITGFMAIYRYLNKQPAVKPV